MVESSSSEQPLWDTAAGMPGEVPQRATVAQRDDMAGSWVRKPKSRQVLGRIKQTHNDNRSCSLLQGLFNTLSRRDLPQRSPELGIWSLRDLSLLTAKWHLCKGRGNTSLRKLTENLDFNFRRSVIYKGGRQTQSEETMFGVEF